MAAKSIGSLTPKKETLVRARASGKSFDECAKEAGYHDRSSAHRALSTDVNAQQALAQKIEEGMTARKLSPEWIIERLINEITTGDTAGARVRALELLGKLRDMGLFVDQTKMEVSDPRQAASDAASLIHEWAGQHNHEANKQDILLWVLGHYGLSD